MKVYASPIEAPSVSVLVREGTERYDQLTRQYLEQLEAWLRAHGFRHPLTGEVVKFPVADSYAQYMVANGTTLIHLPLGDAYQIPGAYARGLRLADIKAQVQGRKGKRVTA